MSKETVKVAIKELESNNLIKIRSKRGARGKRYLYEVNPVSQWVGQKNITVTQNQKLTKGMTTQSAIHSPLEVIRRKYELLMTRAKEENIPSDLSLEEYTELVSQPCHTCLKTFSLSLSHDELGVTCFAGRLDAFNAQAYCGCKTRSAKSGHGELPNPDITDEPQPCSQPGCSGVIVNFECNKCGFTSPF